MNGDILTTLNLANLLAHHRESKASATLAVHQRTVSIDYGVIEMTTDQILQDYVEKPKLPYLVSMGINVFEPEVFRFMRPGQYLDIPDLIKTMRSHGLKISCYVNDAYWLDIGRPDDYQQAVDEFPRIRAAFEGNEP